VNPLAARLAGLAARGETTHYGALARDLGLRVAEVTAQLEAMMEEDTALGRPLRAALVTARGSPLPARGFFDKAAALGHEIPDPAAFVRAQRTELVR
jgi:hypothetical protein